MNSSVQSSLFSRFRNAGDAPLPTRRWVILLAIACLVAITASGYLGWVALTSSKVAGCGGGKLFNCGHVISSRWSLWMGIPVSLMAVGLYVSMAISLFVGASSRFTKSIRHIGWVLVTVLAISAGMAAVWFISLQVFVLNHLCTYCLVAHSCGLIAAAAVLWRRPIGLAGLGPVLLLSFAGIAILIGGQLLTEPPKTYRIEQFEVPAATDDASEFEAPVFDAPDFEASAATPAKSIDENGSPLIDTFTASVATILRPSSMLSVCVTATVQQEASQQSETIPTNATTEVKQTQQTDDPKANIATSKVAKERRFVPINGGTVKLDVAQWPLSGSQSAKYIFVEMFDYSCPHCRHTHAGIKKASELLNGDMAVVVLPIPLNADCNGAIQVTNPKFIESCEISKLALAVWRVDPAKFTEFHNWMFATEEAPNFAAAKAYADTLVDVEKLDSEIASGVPSQYIAKTVELFRRAGSGNVPKLIFPTTTVVGEFTSGKGLAEIIKQQIK